MEKIPYGTSVNLHTFMKLVKGLPDEQQKRLPEKIREIVNRREHKILVEAIALGAYLVLEEKLDLSGYVEDSGIGIYADQNQKSPDGNIATQLRDVDGRILVPIKS
jgi:hypothetical protein